MPSFVPMRSIRMEDEIYLKVKAIALKETRSFNQQVVSVLKQFVTEYEKQNGEIVIDTDVLYE